MLVRSIAFPVVNPLDELLTEIKSMFKSFVNFFADEGEGETDKTDTNEDDDGETMKRMKKMVMGKMMTRRKKRKRRKRTIRIKKISPKRSHPPLFKSRSIVRNLRKSLKN